MYGGMEGGYAFIDSSYPRRPGDVARLSSQEFEPTGCYIHNCKHNYLFHLPNKISEICIIG